MITKFYSGDQIKKNEIVRICGTYGRRERCLRGFGGGGELKERDHTEDLAVGGWLILEWFFKKWDGDTWTGLIWLKKWAGDGLL